jgi:hypothetical protein
VNLKTLRSVTIQPSEVASRIGAASARNRGAEGFEVQARRRNAAPVRVGRESVPLVPGADLSVRGRCDRKRAVIVFRRPPVESLSSALYAAARFLRQRLPRHLLAFVGVAAFLACAKSPATVPGASSNRVIVKEEHPSFMRDGVDLVTWYRNDVRPVIRRVSLRDDGKDVSVNSINDVKGLIVGISSVAEASAYLHVLSDIDAPTRLVPIFINLNSLGRESFQKLYEYERMRIEVSPTGFSVSRLAVEDSYNDGQHARRLGLVRETISFKGDYARASFESLLEGADVSRVVSAIY